MKFSKSKIAIPYLLFASGVMVFLIMLNGCSLPVIKFQRSIRFDEKETIDLIRYMKKHKIDTNQAFYIDEDGLVEVLNNTLGLCINSIKYI